MPIFGKNSKIQNGRHFWGGEIFLKIAKIAFLRYPVGRKFRRNFARNRSKFVFCHQKFENSKWPHRGILKIAKIALLRTLQNFAEMLYLARLFCFAKIRKFKMAAIFGEGKIFAKIAKIAFLRSPVGRKFRRNRSISHG